MSWTRVTDSPASYGLVSKMFHWGMALLFGLQLATVLMRVFFWEAGGALQETTRALWRLHGQNGALILALTLARGIWGLLNAKRRPPHEDSAMGKAAWLGQLALYALMIAVPTIALLRFYGMARAPFVAFGAELMPKAPSVTQWMVDLGNTTHGLLGWTLFALAAGHGFMALLHHYLWRDATLARMASDGTPPAPRGARPV